MRASLWGMNALALAVLVTPALLIFASAGSSLARDPVWAAISLASILMGAVSLVFSMMRLNSGGRDAVASFAGLLFVGLGLIIVPTVFLTFAPIE